MELSPDSRAKAANTWKRTVNVALAHRKLPWVRDILEREPLAALLLMSHTESVHDNRLNRCYSWATVGDCCEILGIPSPASKSTKEEFNFQHALEALRFEAQRKVSNVTPLPVTKTNLSRAKAVRISTEARDRILHTVNVVNCFSRVASLLASRTNSAPDGKGVVDKISTWVLITNNSNESKEQIIEMCARSHTMLSRLHSLAIAEEHSAMSSEIKSGREAMYGNHACPVIASTLNSNGYTCASQLATKAWSEHGAPANALSLLQNRVSQITHGFSTAKTMKDARIGPGNVCAVLFAVSELAYNLDFAQTCKAVLKSTTISHEDAQRFDTEMESIIGEKSYSKQLLVASPISSHKLFSTCSKALACALLPAPRARATGRAIVKGKRSSANFNVVELISTEDDEGNSIQRNISQARVIVKPKQLKVQLKNRSATTLWQLSQNSLRIKTSVRRRGDKRKKRQRNKHQSEKIKLSLADMYQQINDGSLVLPASCKQCSNVKNTFTCQSGKINFVGTAKGAGASRRFLPAMRMIVEASKCEALCQRYR